MSELEEQLEEQEPMINCIINKIVYNHQSTATYIKPHSRLKVSSSKGNTDKNKVINTIYIISGTGAAICLTTNYRPTGHYHMEDVPFHMHVLFPVLLLFLKCILQVMFCEGVQHCLRFCLITSTVLTWRETESHRGLSQASRVGVGRQSRFLVKNVFVKKEA
jgi:hypothetical protein